MLQSFNVLRNTTVPVLCECTIQLIWIDKDDQPLCSFVIRSYYSDGITMTMLLT